MNPRLTFTEASFAMILTVLAADAADFQQVHERAQSQGTVYFTVLNKNDYYNSNGEHLTSVADILRQDRANYHNGQGGPRARMTEGSSQQRRVAVSLTRMPLFWKTSPRLALFRDREGLP